MTKCYFTLESSWANEMIHMLIEMKNVLEEKELIENTNYDSMIHDIDAILSDLGKDINYYKFKDLNFSFSLSQTNLEKLLVVLMSANLCQIRPCENETHYIDIILRAMK